MKYHPAAAIFPIPESSGERCLQKTIAESGGYALARFKDRLIFFWPSSDHAEFVWCEHIEKGIVEFPRRPILSACAFLFCKFVEFPIDSAFISVGSTTPRCAPTVEPSQKRRHNGSGYVYFAEAIGTGRVKIGRADNVDSRLRDLRGICPVELRLIGLIPESDFSEVTLHRMFDENRLHGEWFKLDDSIRGFISQNGVTP